jgi:hypothetical protein
MLKEGKLICIMCPTALCCDDANIFLFQSADFQKTIASVQINDHVCIRCPWRLHKLQPNSWGEREELPRSIKTKPHGMTWPGACNPTQPPSPMHTTVTHIRIMEDATNCSDCCVRNTRREQRIASNVTLNQLPRKDPCTIRWVTSLPHRSANCKLEPVPLAGWERSFKKRRGWRWLAQWSPNGATGCELCIGVLRRSNRRLHTRISRDCSQETVGLMVRTDVSSPWDICLFLCCCSPVLLLATCCNNTAEEKTGVGIIAIRRIHQT